MELSIVIPCRDEGPNLQILIPELVSVLNNIQLNNYEIIILNHGSQDFTSDLIKEFQKREIHIIEKWYDRKKYRLGHVLKHGIASANGRYIITMDGDLSHQPQSLPFFIMALKSSHDFIIGVRYNRDQPPFEPKQRYLISKIFNLIAKLFIRTEFSDFTSGYRAFKKDLFTSIQNTLKSEGFEIHLELNGKLSKIAKKKTSIPINYIKRSRGNSKLRYKSEFLGYIKAIFWTILDFDKYREVEWF